MSGGGVGGLSSSCVQIPSALQDASSQQHEHAYRKDTIEAEILFIRHTLRLCLFGYTELIVTVAVVTFLMIAFVVVCQKASGTRGLHGLSCSCTVRRGATSSFSLPN